MQDNRGVFTRQEILSQPDTWVETLNYLKKDWEEQLPVLQDYDQVIFTGCGSTYFFSIWAARLLQKRTSMTCIAVPGSELWYSGKDWIDPRKKTLLVAVSRSGRTTETLHALEFFLQSGLGDALTITCYADSPLAEMTPITFATSAGQEKSIAQTRSFTNMMWPVMLLAERQIPDHLIAAVDRTSHALLEAGQVKAVEIGSDFSIERFFFLGDGPLYGLALEVMLKMKEMSLSYSEAFHFLEFRHGPMSMVNANSLTIGFTDPNTAAFELPVFEHMQKLGSKTLAVGRFDNKPEMLDMIFDIAAEVPQVWSYPLYLPFIQLIAYERSISKGLNPDQPQNLSGVVEL